MPVDEYEAVSEVLVPKEASETPRLKLIVEAAMKKADDEDGGNAALATPRLLVVSSMSGKLPVPLLAPYSASKHAVACLRASNSFSLKIDGAPVIGSG